MERIAGGVGRLRVGQWNCGWEKRGWEVEVLWVWGWKVLGLEEGVH